MGQKDMAEKMLEKYNDVFADIFNVLLFQKEVLNQECLKDGPTESIFKSENEDYREQRRDVMKTYRDCCQMEIAFLGIENQTKFDRYIPMRVMGYDYTKYRYQVDDEVFPLRPVITIVLNFGEAQWGECKKLSDIMDIPPEFAPYVQDYEVRVFDIAYLPDEVIERFKSDFRMIARFFRNKRLGINPLDDTEEICHVEEFIDFLAVFTKDTRYKKTKEYVEQLKKKGVKVSMCNIAQGLLDEGRAEGREEGEDKLAKLMNYLLSNDMTEEAKKAAADEVARKEMYVKYGIEDV